MAESSTSADTGQSPNTQEFLDDDVFLKLKLDSIFAEVQASLPSIDFEVSDMSSDEDLPIFHRALKTPTSDEEKDLDSSVTSQDYRDLLSSSTHIEQSGRKSLPSLISPCYSVVDNIQRNNASMALDSNILESLNSASFPVLDEIENILNQNTRPASAGAAVTLKSQVMSEGSIKFQKEIDKKKRPKTAGVSSSSDGSLGKKETVPVPLKNTWVQHDNNVELSVKTDSPESPTTLEKRKEIPELSPKSGENVKNTERNRITSEGSLKSAMKQKGSSHKHTEGMKKEHQEDKEVVSQYFNDAPSISLESVDLDNILIGIVTGTRLPPAYNETQNDQKEPSLIHRLAEMSMGEQTNVQKDIDPETGAYKAKAVGIKEIKTAKNKAVVATDVQKKTTTSMGTNTNDLPNLPRAALPSPTPPQDVQEKKPTVYIDLRGFEKKKEESQSKFLAVQRILGISEEKQASSSDESEDDEPVMWHEQRKKIKECLTRTGTVPTLAEKPKIRKASLPKTPVAHTQAQRLAGHLPKPKQGDEEQNNSPANTSPPDSPSQEASEGKVRPKTAKEVEEEERIKRLEEAKIKRGKREAERQSRIRLGQRLEALRPKESSTSKQPSAEATPVLFDTEASYEPSPSTLPSVIMPHHEMLLLTVNLSSNGEVTLHRSKTNHSVDTGMGLSATYTTILTWLLSQVPNDYTYLHEPPQMSQDQSALGICPFYVVGLQQLYLEGQLALYVAITPVESFDMASEKKKPAKKSKQVKDEIKDSTAFQKAVHRYLTSNKLETVCLWLSDLVSVGVKARTQSNQENGDEQPYIYKPDLPNITQKPLSTFVQVNPDPNAVNKIFGLESGFFWETIETDEVTSESLIRDESIEYETQNTMSLIYRQIYRDPSAIMGILNRVLQEGFDLAGVRLLYPTLEVMRMNPATSTLPTGILSTTENQSPIEVLNNLGPILALAIRGSFARTLWLDAIGPSDPILARKTDPNSLCALYGGQSRDECFLFCPRNPTRVLTELARWFGGRVPASRVIDVGHASKRGGKKANKKGSPQSKDTDIPVCKPPATLAASIRGEVFLVVSPLIPTKCMGLLLSNCQRRGYQLRGVKRCRLTPKRAQLLGISFGKIPVFTLQTSTPSSPIPGHDPLAAFDLSEQYLLSSTKTSPNPCTILLLNKENAAHTMASLIESFMVQMSLLNLLGSLQKALHKSSDHEVSWSDFFYIVNYSDSLYHALGGDFSKTPEADLATTPGYIAPTLYSNPEQEEIVVLTLTGHAFMKNFGLFLSKVQNVVPFNQKSSLPSLLEGFELLGIKWLPGLSIQHAKELTPLEVGDKNWKSSIHMLTSEPAVILVLRGINSFRRLEALIAQKQVILRGQKPPQLDRIMSPTPETAFRQACIFFKEHELFPDNDARPLLPFLPPVRPPKIDVDSHMKSKKGKAMKPTHQSNFVEENIFHAMQAGPRPLTTVLVVKPDVVHKHLGKLLKRVTQEGFKVVGLRLETLDYEQASSIVPVCDQQNECMHKLHTDYLTSDTCLLLCLQRENAVKKLCDILGPEDPKEAKRTSSFAWRAVFGVDPVANGLHGSANYKKSVLEQKVFFPHGVCCKETDDLIDEGIGCPGEDSFINLQEGERKVVFSDRQSDQDTGSKIRASGTSGKRVLPVTSLTQTNCILLLPTLMQSEGRAKHYPFVDVIDSLVNQGLELVGARMVWMTTYQAQHYLHLINAGSFSLVPCLTNGPCLILAVQRDNAVLAFDAYLGSSYDKDSIYSKHNFEIMRAKDLTQARNLLTFFFDKLSPESYAQIVDNSTSD